jgi:hypothetical protein
MERCARSLFARTLRDELPDGWQLDVPDRCTGIAGQMYRIAGIFLMLCAAHDEASQREHALHYPNHTIEHRARADQRRRSQPTAW